MARSAYGVLAGTKPRRRSRGTWRTRVRSYPGFNGMLPAAAMLEEIETPGEGQIRALVSVAGNPVLSVPGGAQLAQALAGSTSWSPSTLHQ